MHLYLIGYRGSGKTTVGRLVAQALDWLLVDTDDWIESASGRTIQQIFAEAGEQAFRDLEQTTIEQVASLNDSIVVSLGGGAILRPQNRTQIRRGKCVWLDAPAEFLYQRICNDPSSSTKRPNLTKSSGLDEVNEVLAVRRPLYAELANLTIDVVGRSADEIAREIVDWVTFADPA